MSTVPKQRSRAPADAVVLAIAAALVLLAAARLELYSRLLGSTPSAGTLPFQALSTLSVVLLALSIFVWRRYRELRREVEGRRDADAEQARLIHELQETLARVRALHGILAICSWCKSIRDPAGEWLPLEEYLEYHFQTFTSHGVCPECMRVQYPALFDQ